MSIKKSAVAITAGIVLLLFGVVADSSGKRTGSWRTLTPAQDLSPGSPRWFVQADSLADTFRDIVALDTLTAWAVGSFNVKPVIFHTSDGGIHWIQQPVSTTWSYIGWGVSFPDPRHGWVMGSEYRYLSTSNGGQSWQEHDFPARFDPTRVKFVDSLTGWIIGTSDTVLHTTDGGRTWVKQLVGDYGGALFDLDFLSRTYGWVVGGGGSGRLILRTTDGGIVWQRFPGYFTTYQAVDLLDSLHGWFNSALGGVTFTFDGGVTWHDTTLPGSGNNSYSGLSFIDSLRGWTAGSGGFLRGQILRTIDGGYSWSFEVQDSLVTLRRVTMLDSTHGWAVGENGLILVYGVIVLGDLNWDKQITATDVVLELNKVFLGEAFSSPEEAGDVNCDSSFSPADVVLLLLKVFLNQPFPCSV